MSMAETSPVIEEKQDDVDIKVGFGFAEAMSAVVDGHKVARDDWQDDVFLQMKDGFLMIKNETGWHQLLVSEADMVADDWEIVK
jgi:hypothetical protein